ncbi:MAG TPA: hypothetical protein VNZ54_11050 [bacterium]|jgi:hypothetical protein|nr:hypothetical protein [bacterium]
MARRFRLFAACLALLSLGALPLHVWAHLTGHEPAEKGGEPCQVCQAALHHVAVAALGAAPAQLPPAAYSALFHAPTLDFQGGVFCKAQSRGPPHLFPS